MAGPEDVTVEKFAHERRTSSWPASGALVVVAMIVAWATGPEREHPLGARAWPSSSRC